MTLVESFNGDIAELSSMLRSAWAANKQEPLLYTEDFLASVLSQPGAALDLCPAIYDEGALVGFAAALPRQVALNGFKWNIAITSFLTVALDHQKGSGLGVLLWNELAERAKQHGLSGMISYCVEGDKMDQGILNIARYCRVPTQKVYTVRYLARPVRKTGGPLGKADPEILLRCATQLSETREFVRIWTKEEAIWQSDKREGAFGAAIQNRDTEGTISASTMWTSGTKPIRCGLIDDVLWHDLDHLDKKKLVERLLDSASAAGVDLMLIPLMNYADMTPFLDVGFRKTRRALNMYLSSWDPELAIEELSAPYIDVF